MKKAITTIQTLLKVKPTQNYVFTDEQLTSELIYKWNESIIGDNKGNKGMIDLVIDLFIFLD